MLVKKITTALLLIFVILPAMAQNKVVVVPLLNEAQKASAVDLVGLGGGVISAAGGLSSAWGVPMTTSSSSTGNYAISIPGVRPGCAGDLPHVFTNHSRAGFAYYGGAGTNCISGDVSINIIVRNHENVAQNDVFYFHIISPNGFPSSLSSNNSSATGINSQSNLNKSYPTKCVFDATSRLETCE